MSMWTTCAVSGVRLIGNLKLHTSVNVSVNGYLSRLPDSPVTDQLAFQDVPRLSPNGSWDRLLPPTIMNWVRRIEG